MPKGRMSDEHREKIRQAVLKRNAEKRQAADPAGVQNPLESLQDLPGDVDLAGTPEGVPEPTTAAQEAVLAAQNIDPGNLDQLTAVAKMLAGAIAEAQQNNNKGLVDALEESQRRLQAHENPVPPLVSAFNPLGDRDNPRPKLLADVTQCGFPVQPAACTREELELLNQFIEVLNTHRRENKNLPVFRVTKADGTSMTVKLDIQWDDLTSNVRRLAINYPVKTADMRSGLYSFTHMMQEMLGLEMPQVDTASLMARVRALEAENQQLRASAA